MESGSPRSDADGLLSQLEIVVYAPIEPRLIPLRVKFRGEDQAWLDRLREMIDAGLEPALALEPGAGAVLQGANDVKRPEIGGSLRGEIVSRLPLADGADLLAVAREVRRLPRRVIRGFTVAVVDRDGDRVGWHVRAADCRLLAGYGVLRLFRGWYRYTPLGQAVRAVVLGGVVKIARKKL